MPTYYLRRNDALVPIAAVLTGPDGTAMDLTDATVHLHVGVEGEPENVLLDVACTVDPSVPGRVIYYVTAADSDLEEGEYAAEFECRWDDGTIRTVPTRPGSFKWSVGGEVG
jgi:hypothetical protein